MKKLLFIFFILFSLTIVFTACNHEDAKTNELIAESSSDIQFRESCNYEVLDLNRDRVNRNGVTVEMQEELMSQGYSQFVLEEDAIGEVEFRSEETGERYTQVGIVQAGNSVWGLEEPDYGIDREQTFILAVCANVYTQWRWMCR